jgi:hypothetical protein
MYCVRLVCSARICVVLLWVLIVVTMAGESGAPICDGRRVDRACWRSGSSIRSFASVG